MTADDDALRPLLEAIAAGDEARALGLLSRSPELARAAVVEGATRTAATKHYLRQIGRYLYAGDTALHVAAAAYRPEMARRLIGLGAGVGARNWRGAEPLHAAAVGQPGAPTWNPQAQAAAIACLIAAGADPNAADQDGVTPLHRAVRTRCAAAARTLLELGADPARPNGSGSTPLRLANTQTGRGGSGSPEAKAQQAQIVELLEQFLS